MGWIREKMKVMLSVGSSFWSIQRTEKKETYQLRITVFPSEKVRERRERRFACFVSPKMLKTKNIKINILTYICICIHIRIFIYTYMCKHVQHHSKWMSSITVFRWREMNFVRLYIPPVIHTRLVEWSVVTRLTVGIYPLREEMRWWKCANKKK